jgi:hypothetical protein
MLARNLVLDTVAIHPNSGEKWRSPTEKQRKWAEDFVSTGLDPVIHLF